MAISGDWIYTGNASYDGVNKRGVVGTEATPGNILQYTALKLPAGTQAVNVSFAFGETAHAVSASGQPPPGGGNIVGNPNFLTGP